MEKIKQFVAIAPKTVNREYLTAGKEYPMFDIDGILGERNGRFGVGFAIISDKGNKMYCLERECEHLDCKNWIIKEVK